MKTLPIQSKRHKEFLKKRQGGTYLVYELLDARMRGLLYKSPVYKVMSKGIQLPYPGYEESEPKYKWDQFWKWLN